jgi:hypothetical protein
MSAPSIIKVSPNPNQTDVVLGTTVVVGFDQAIDTTTITSSTFSLTGPGQTQVISPEELNVKNPWPDTGREYIAGAFSFSTDVNGNTIATFTPSSPLRPNVIYTVLVVGGLGSVLGAAVKNLDTPPDTLDSNYQWTFTTGDLDVSVPPVTSPIAPLVVPLDPSRVQIQQRLWAVGNDLSQELDIIFPAPIDTTTVTPEQILLSLEPILNDPSVSIPSGLTPTVTISGNKISIVISGWPMN